MPDMPKANKFEQESVGKLMMELCVQTTFSIMLYNFFTITDTFFVARGVGMAASGAVGIFSPVLILIGGISSALGAGGGSVIARKMGENKKESGRSVTGCVLYIWLVSSLVITAAGLICLKPLLSLLGCTPELYPYASAYGSIMLAGTIAGTGFSGIMRAEGDSAFSTFQWCLPVCMNLALDPLFIFKFKWGISGAAAATLTAQFCSMLSSLYYFFFRPKTPCRIGLCHVRFCREIGREVFGIGIPIFLNNLGSGLAGAIGNQIIGSVGGTAAISVYAVISRIHGFAATPFMGVMQGIQPMLGFDYGRNNRLRMEQTMQYAFRFVVGYGSLAAVCLFLGAEYIFGIFQSAHAASYEAVIALRTICWGLAAGGIMPVTQAYYQALGQGKMVLKLSLCSILFIRLPLLFLAGIMKNLPGLWGIIMGTEWLIAGSAYYFFRRTYDGKFDKVQAG